MDTPLGSDAHVHCCNFLSNHTLVLLSVARSPDMRVREIAKVVGITERATQAILSELDREGYVDRIRSGRRNHYRVRRAAKLRHPLASDTAIGDLLDVLTPVLHPSDFRLTG
jgi:DNA-binding MarR family transcriptional regulator